MAIGFLECAGYGALLYAMDRACKAADIKILGIDTINPKNTNAFIPLTAQVKFEGSISDVKVAIEVAKEAALRFNEEKDIITAVIEAPYTGVVQMARISKVKFHEV